MSGTEMLRAACPACSTTKSGVFIVCFVSDSKGIITELMIEAVWVFFTGLYSGFASHS